MQFKRYTNHKSKYHIYKTLLRLAKCIDIHVPFGSSLESHEIGKVGITTHFICKKNPQAQVVKRELLKVN